MDIDGRVLPGQDAAEWARQVQAAVGDEVEVTLLHGGAGVAADPASPFYDAIAATMGEVDPGARLLPYLVSGGTDARAMPGIKVYGFMPAPEWRGCARPGARPRRAHARGRSSLRHALPLWGCHALRE